MDKYKSLEKYSDVLNVKEVGEFLNVSKDTVRKLCLENKLKHIRIGSLYKITKENLVHFIEQTQ